MQADDGCAVFASSASLLNTLVHEKKRREKTKGNFTPVESDFFLFAL